MLKKMHGKDRALVISLIVTGVLLTAWTADMVIMSSRMWFPS